MRLEGKLAAHFYQHRRCIRPRAMAEQVDGAVSTSNSTSSWSGTFNWFTTSTNWIWPSNQAALSPSVQQPARVPALPQSFNRYVNASDMLEEFIAFLGEEGVRQGEVMSLPVDLFIKWLIIKACEEEGAEPNVTLKLPPPKAQPRCVGCQRFLPAAAPIRVHNLRCADFYFAREAGK